MKKIFTFLATILCLNLSAQTFHIDSTVNQAYVNIDPIPLSVLGTDIQLTRLYINIQQYIPRYSVSYTWSICWSRIIDSTTTICEPLISGNVQLPITSNPTLNDATMFLFNYVQDSVRYKGQPLNIEIIE